MRLFQVAEDNYKALLSFFAKFPNFTRNEFFIFGESYGGIYVPTLSLRLVTGSAKIKFKVSGVIMALLLTMSFPLCKKSFDLPKRSKKAVSKYCTVRLSRVFRLTCPESAPDQIVLMSKYFGVIGVFSGKNKHVFSGLCSGKWYQQLCTQ